MSELYIVKMRRVYNAAENKSFVLPILWTINVLKETAKNYLVEGEEATGYHSRISKDDVLYATSVMDAWDIYISRVSATLRSMKSAMTDHNEALKYAKEQRRCING
jgi:hypothetical protein